MICRCELFPFCAPWLMLRMPYHSVQDGGTWPFSAPTPSASARGRSRRRSWPDFAETTSRKFDGEAFGVRTAGRAPRQIAQTTWAWGRYAGHGHVGT